ncbi:DUF2784 domain-containing protein [Verrucomicrobiota bacterium]
MIAKQGRACQAGGAAKARGAGLVPDTQRLLADTILITHALFVAFVVAGLGLIVAGILLKWSWVRNPWFRGAHLASIAFVVAEAWIGRLCPLTVWESRLREAAGETGYSGAFVQHWLERLIYYDFAPWVFTLAYTLFGVLVLLTWIAAPPRRRGP